ncbi:MAG: hypothetical protein GTO22_09450 [Gemmatimonadales bacterium]|nr:hypothetical protein [Gemmatimonadales bacterium]
MRFEFEDVWVWLYRRPALFRAAGEALFQIGAAGLLAGAFAKVVAVTASAVPGSAAPGGGIAQHYPNLWTWWVPESPAFLATYVAIAVAGAILASASKKVQRQMRNF